MELFDIVREFAAAMTLADSRRPVATSPQSGRVYQAGIGPHPEDRAVGLVRCAKPWVCYPASKQTCDLLLGDPVEWAIEIKMFRPNGDNGKPDDTAIKDVLSPFATDRSALIDAVKLATFEITPQRA